MRQESASVDRTAIWSDFPDRRRSVAPARRNRRDRRTRHVSDRWGGAGDNLSWLDRCRFAPARSRPIGPATLIAARRRSPVVIADEQDLRKDRAAWGSLRQGSPQSPRLESMPLSLRPAAVFVRASNLAFVVLLAACVEHQSLPSDPTGRLF